MQAQDVCEESIQSHCQGKVGSSSQTIKHHYRGLERRLGGQEHGLLLQRIRVLFPVLVLGLSPRPARLAPGDLPPSSGFCGNPIMWTHSHGHTHIKLNLKKIIKKQTKKLSLKRNHIKGHEVS